MSASRKPRVLLDVDGVLGDFCGHLLNFMSSIEGLGELPTKEELTKWDIFEFFNSQQRTAAQSILKSGHFWAVMPTLDRAIIAVKSLEAADIVVHYVTSPWDECFGWADVRRDWLVRYFGARRQAVHTAAEKHVYHGDVFVDDKPEHVYAWHKEHQDHPGHHVAFMYDQPYNKNEKWPNRLDGWSNFSIESVIRAAKTGKVS